jgi:hypothetical protein
MGNPNLASSVRVPEEEEEGSNALWSGTVYTSRERDCGNSALHIESNSALYWLLMLEQLEV